MGAQPIHNLVHLALDSTACSTFHSFRLPYASDVRPATYPIVLPTSCYLNLVADLHFARPLPFGPIFFIFMQISHRNENIKPNML